MWHWLHCTSSRSDHAQKTFQMTKEVALTGLDTLVDSILGHASLLTICKLKILVEYFYTHCRHRWDATVFKVKDNPHRHNLFICLFVYLIWLVMSQSTIFQSCWDDFRSSWAKTVLRCIYCVCSRTHLHSDSAGRESWISILSIPSLTFYHLCPYAPLSSTDVPFSSAIKITIHWLNLESKHMSWVRLWEPSWVRLWEPYWGVYSAALFWPKVCFSEIPKPHLQASIQELKWQTDYTASKMPNTKQDFSLVIDRNTSWTLSLLHSHKVHPSINVSVKGSSSS